MQSTKEFLACRLSVQIPVVSAHAVKRYMERTGCKSPERARTKVEYCFLNGKKLKGDPKATVSKIYGRGFVLVVKENLIITIYRPTAPHIRKKVYNIHKNERRQNGNVTPRRASEEN